MDTEKEESARVYSFEADEAGNGDQNPQQGNATQHLRMKKSQVSPIPFKIDVNGRPNSNEQDDTRSTKAAIEIP